jgi:hypothetical protein
MRIFGDYIASIEDPKERREEAEQMWRDLDVIARLIVKGRRR